MKRTLLTAAMIAALTNYCFAGPDEPMAQHDGKDMKDMKQQSTMSSESDAGFYVAAFGGAQFDTQYGDNRQTLSAGGANIQSNADLHSGWGGVGGLKVGYDFNSFAMGNMMGLRLQPAVEAEGMYIGLDDSHSDPHAFAPGVTSRFTSNSGDFFLNGILRFKNNSKVTPYIGVGPGLQYITTHGSLTGAGVNLTGLDTSDLDFAVQGLFGINVDICKHVSLFSEYKFIDALGTDAKNSSVGGDTYRFKPDQIQQNLITAGVKYSF